MARQFTGKFQSGSEDSGERAFKFEQFALYVEPTSVTAQRPIRSNNAMTRHDNRNGIAIISESDGPIAVWATDSPGNIGVGASFAVGNFKKRAPASHLEWGAAKI